MTAYWDNGPLDADINWWRLLLYRILPKPRALAAEMLQRDSKQAKAVLVLSQHPNPSFSYYLEERLKALKGVRVIVRSLNDESLEDIDPDRLFVVICRYIRSKQLKWLERNAENLSGVGLFLDDDIAAVIAGPEAGPRYKLKLIMLGIMPLRRLNPLLRVIWASTEPLVKAISAQSSNVVLMPPTPPVERVALKQSRSLTMGYHATGVHGPEHRFLVPIVETAMRRHGCLHFEVFASGRNAAIWRGAKIDPNRLHVLPELPWADYLSYCGKVKVDIALVPLLPGRANACRADTKRIDVCRLGAAAIFSDTDVFNRNRQAGELHVKNTCEDWLAAIDELVASSERRLAAASATRASLQQMTSHADLQIAGLQSALSEVSK